MHGERFVSIRFTGPINEKVQHNLWNRNDLVFKPNQKWMPSIFSAII